MTPSHMFSHYLWFFINLGIIVVVVVGYLFSMTDNETETRWIISGSVTFGSKLGWYDQSEFLRIDPIFHRSTAS